MAEELGIAVLAEGIETERQRTLVIEHGCSLGQGFLFGRPVSPVDISAGSEAARGVSASEAAVPTRVGVNGQAKTG